MSTPPRFAGGYYFQVKVTVHGCGYKAALSKSKKSYISLQGATYSFIKQTRILLISAKAVPMTTAAFHVLKKPNLQPKGATKAYRKSQSRIFSTEAPQFVGAGAGTDNQDFLADLTTLDVIDPDATVSAEDSPQEQGLTLVPSPLLTF